MNIQNSFSVAAPPSLVWDALMDAPRVIPCMPGTTLLASVDDSHWTAAMSVRIGPIALNFDVQIAREDVDVSARRTLLTAKARDGKGRGGAEAAIKVALREQDAGTVVDVSTNLELSGPVARYGLGMVQPIAEQLTADFASCLESQVAMVAAGKDADVVRESRVEAAPASIARLGFTMLVRPVRQLFGRLGLAVRHTTGAVKR